MSQIALSLIGIGEDDDNVVVVGDDIVVVDDDGGDDDDDDDDDDGDDDDDDDDIVKNVLMLIKDRSSSNFEHEDNFREVKNICILKVTSNICKRLDIKNKHHPISRLQLT